MMLLKKYIKIALVFFTFSGCISDDSLKRISLTGEIEWQKTFGGANDDIARAIIETSDNGYALIGYTNSIDGDITDKTVAENDFWVLK